MHKVPAPHTAHIGPNVIRLFFCACLCVSLLSIRRFQAPILRFPPLLYCNFSVAPTFHHRRRAIISRIPTTPHRNFPLHNSRPPKSLLSTNQPQRWNNTPLLQPRPLNTSPTFLAASAKMAEWLHSAPARPYLTKYVWPPSLLSSSVYRTNACKMSEPGTCRTFSMG